MDLRRIQEAGSYGLNDYSCLPNNTKINNVFNGLESKSISYNKLKISGISNYSLPILKQEGSLRGYGRGPGQAAFETQRQVMQKIIDSASHLSIYDQALLLSMAKVESGFNPDAAAVSSSASGIFQIVKNTATNLGLPQAEVFDADKNIEAGVALFEENSLLVSRRYPMLSSSERAIKIYALHHDGPSLQYGGEKIARERVLPELKIFLHALNQYYQSRLCAADAKVLI